jgi:hypothetical protein
LKAVDGNASAEPGRDRGDLPRAGLDVPDSPRPAAETVLTASQVTPAPHPVAPLSESRRRGALASLTRLDAAYTELTDLKNQRLGMTVLLGASLGIGVGAVAGIIAMTDPKLLSARIGIGVALLTWGVYVSLVRFGVRVAVAKARKRANALIEELASEFQEEIASWGGRSVLRDPVTVRRLRQELDPPPAAPPTSGSGPEEISDPTRRALLVARLQQHATLLKDTKDNSDLTWVGLCLLWLFVPLIGVGFGGVPAGWDYHYRPYWPMVTFGLAGGILAGCLFWWAMASVRRWLVRTREAEIDRFAADYPRLVEGWGGRGVLESTTAVAALLRTIDSSIAAGRLGFFRRLFGG